ncbi:MAG TPA: translocation/assembly module TamB domain-containing protein [Gemmatimonadaceae bacterium]|nr:translocation/assembly module TamB domain-containing protein [Gemmatimonadaceae bacterium]
MIKRRHLVALVSVIVLVTIGLLAFAAGLLVTRTDYGTEQLRRLIQRQIADGVRGKVYLGHVSGGFLTGFTVDSFAIRDADNDSLFLSTGRVIASYDPRDLIDKRLFLRNVEVEHPVVYLRLHQSGRWNFKEIFKAYDRKRGPKTPGLSFGDYVVIDSARVHDGTLVLQMPWEPDDTLHGTRLDSAIQFNLARSDKDIRRAKDEGEAGFTHTWTWTRIQALSSRMRLADPDSNKFGRLFVIDSLSVAESDPPFLFHNVHGTMRNLGDSIWVEVPHFDLPASTGSGAGKIWWGSDLPVRYDLSVRGDSVSLGDVSWVYPTLPTTGGGKVLLHIGNDPKNLHVMNYVLKDMDVRSTSSHLVGDMTFAVGGPVLAVKDVNMHGDPFDFDLLRTLNGKPFPVDWRGRIYGSVRARGGPLNHFYVDEGSGSFRDAHVPGAVSRFSGHGEIDILQPAFTAFHGLSVDVASLDLRSIEFLYPNFPRLGGTISGTAVLDSSWLDVRFSNADVLHHDGPGEPSHVTGSGRVTWGEQFMTYDVDLQAQPLSLTTLARSYPKLPLRGTLSGPFRAKGTVADLAVSTSLQGAAGALSFDGSVDIFPPAFTMRGKGQFTGLALQNLLDEMRLAGRSMRPVVLNGQYDVDMSGDSLSNLSGALALDVARADVEGVRVFPSRARLRFGSGLLHVDTLRVETTAATIVAGGTLGLPHGPAASLHFQLAVDSLGGLRRYLAPGRGDEAAGDSLAGTIVLAGTAGGRVDSLDLAGTISGAGLHVGSNRGSSLSGHFDVRNALASPVGTFTARMDTVSVAGVALDSVDAGVQFEGKSRASFVLAAASENGPRARLAGNFTADGGAAIGAATSVTRLRLDTLDLTVGDNAWRLAAPVHASRDSTGLLLDSLVLRSRSGGRVAVSGIVPVRAPVSLSFRADSLPASDVGMLAQLPSAVSGIAAFQGQVTGTRAAPEISLRSTVHDLTAGGLRVERATAAGEYRDRRFDAAVDLYRDGRPALHATAALPVALTLFSAQRLDLPLSGSIRADSTDLAVVEMLSPSVQQATGRLTANLDISGSWERPRFGGAVSVANGDLWLQNLGIRLRGLNGGVSLDAPRDSLTMNLSAWSGTGPADRIALAGWVGYADLKDPHFHVGLYTRNFHAIDRRSTAALDISTGTDSLLLAGSLHDATLTGTVVVNRGSIYLPERDVARKQVVDLTGSDLFALLDSADARSRQIIPDAPSELVANLRLDGVHVEIGDEVWLRSREANVKLGGSLNVTSARKDSRVASGRTPRVGGGAGEDQGPKYGLALEGQLQAERGTYTLDLSPVPVQREFQVQQGTITFYGTADNNPNVDITATHNVKRSGQPDLVVAVHILGPLIPNPSIELTSNESYLSTSDLVSYIVTGQPTYALNQEGANRVAQASAVLVPTLTALGAQTLRSSLGSWVDLVQLQSGATDLTGQTGAREQGRSTFTDYLYGARLGGEKQISNNLFFSLSAGLCSLDRQYLQSQSQSALGSFVDALAGKLEYRFNPETSLQAGTEPGTTALYCGRANASLGSLIQTPRQWGLSLLHTWHF